MGELREGWQADFDAADAEWLAARTAWAAAEQRRADAVQRLTELLAERTPPPTPLNPGITVSMG